jgi:xanthine dehydrogenase YagS FAD-binding subunit
MERFELAQPKTLTEAIELLNGEWDESGGRSAVPLAGGQDLLTVLKEGLETPERLVQLRGVEGLGGIEVGERKELVIGSMVTVAEVGASVEVQRRARALAEAADGVGSPQIRNLATVGGNLCQRPRCWYYRNSDAPCLKKGGYECFAYGGRNKYNAILGGGPSYIVHPSDLAPALVMLEASVVLHSSQGQRKLPLSEMYVLPADGDVTRETVLAADEVIGRVLVPPLASGWRTSYEKARERGSFDFALAAVALGVRVEGDRIAELRLVLGSVAPVPWRCRGAEALAVGRRNDEETWAAVAEAALEGAQPLSENGYKVPLTKGLIEKAMRRLALEDA